MPKDQKDNDYFDMYYKLYKVEKTKKNDWIKVQ
jgi:hypothetical protein